MLLRELDDEPASSCFVTQCGILPTAVAGMLIGTTTDAAREVADMVKRSEEADVDLGQASGPVDLADGTLFLFPPCRTHASEVIVVGLTPRNATTASGRR